MHCLVQLKGYRREGFRRHFHDTSQIIPSSPGLSSLACSSSFFGDALKAGWAASEALSQPALHLLPIFAGWSHCVFDKSTFPISTPHRWHMLSPSWIQWPLPRRKTDLWNGHRATTACVGIFLALLLLLALEARFLLLGSTTKPF